MWYHVLNRLEWPRLKSYLVLVDSNIGTSLNYLGPLSIFQPKLPHRLIVVGIKMGNCVIHVVLTYQPQLRIATLLLRDLVVKWKIMGPCLAYNIVSSVLAVVVKWVAVGLKCDVLWLQDIDIPVAKYPNCDHEIVEIVMHWPQLWGSVISLFQHHHI